jgi:exodeoxyribonuclease VII large subunit
VTTIRSRFPPAAVLIAETYVQGPRAAAEIVAAIGALCEQQDVDVVILTRGGGSFEDLLPFSDERVVRAVADCRVPVVSAVGHEQDTPLCDLAADVRASTPTAAGKLVVPELTELFGRLDRARSTLARNVRRSLDRDRQRLTRSVERLRARPRIALEREGQRLEHTRERLRQAPALAVERKRAALEKSAAKLVALSPVQTLERGYAIVRTDSGDVVASTSDVSKGTRVEVTVADGGFGARVEEVAE